MTTDPKASPPALAAGSLGELLQVAFPLVISAGSLSLMNVADRIYVAQLGVAAMAASTPVITLSWTTMSLPLGIAAYTNTFVSQYDGAGRKDRVAASIWQGLFVALFGSVLLLPAIFYSDTIFGWMKHGPEVRRMEVEFFNYLCPVAIPMLLSTVLSAYFTSRQRTSVIMWVNVFISVLNILLDPILIFGWYGVPAMGIQGAAIATVFSTAVGTTIFSILLIRDAARNGYPLWEAFGIDEDLLWRMLRYGFPNSMQTLLDLGAFTLFVVLTGQLGDEQERATNLAATNLAFTLNSLAFVPMLGIGTAVLTLVGRRVGEGRPDLATTTVTKAMYLSGGYMIAFAVLYLSAPELILSPFLLGDMKEEFEALRPVVVALLRFVALYTFFDAMAIVYGAATRGAGDTVFSMWFSVLTGWFLMVVPTLAVVHWQGSLYHCWLACTVFVIVLGIGFLLRFRQGKWKSMRVIEVDSAATGLGGATP